MAGSNHPELNAIIEEIELFLKESALNASAVGSSNSTKKYLEAKLNKDEGYEFDYLKKMLDRSGKGLILRCAAKHIKNSIDNYQNLDKSEIRALNEFIRKFSGQLGEEIEYSADKEIKLKQAYEAFKNTIDGIDEKNMQDLIEIYGLKVRSKSLKEELEYFNNKPRVYEEWLKILTNPSADNKVSEQQREVMEKYLKFKKELGDQAQVIKLTEETATPEKIEEGYKISKGFVRQGEMKDKTIWKSFLIPSNAGNRKLQQEKSDTLLSGFLKKIIKPERRKPKRGNRM